MRVGSSWALLILCACGGATGSDGGPGDARPADSGHRDAGVEDRPIPLDAEVDSGFADDAEVADSEVGDAQPSDTEIQDAEPADAEPADSEGSDLTPGDLPDVTSDPDLGGLDATFPDATLPDANADGGIVAPDSGLCPSNGNWTTLELPLLPMPRSGPGFTTLSPAFSLSEDGRHVAYAAHEQGNLAPFQPPFDPYYYNFFRYDLLTGETRVIGTHPNGNWHMVALSPDGSLSAVNSGGIAPWLSDQGSTLFTPETDFESCSSSIFVDNDLVTINLSGLGTGNGCSANARMSRDGRFVVFASTATNLVANDAPDGGNIFLRDRMLGTTVAVTTSSITGLPLDQNSWDNRPEISADGRYIYYPRNGQDWIWDRVLNTHSLGALPVWRQSCAGFAGSGTCIASRDGTTRVIATTDYVRVERVPAAGTPTMIPCPPPITDLTRFYWQPLPYPGIDLRSYASVWTGSEMLSWGEDVPTSLGVLLRYDEAQRVWSTGNGTGQPLLRLDTSAVWTGSELIVWGGLRISPVQTGGAYNPAADQWRTLSTTGAPSARARHGAVWVPPYMVVLGGTPAGAGGRYEAGADVWSAVSTQGQPPTLGERPALYRDGSTVLVWTGFEGARYDPTANTWAPIAAGPTASGARLPSAWNGAQMLVHTDSALWIYDAASNVWTQRTPGLPADFSFSDADAFAFGSTFVIGGRIVSTPAGFAVEANGDIRRILYSAATEPYRARVSTGSRILTNANNGNIWGPPP